MKNKYIEEMNSIHASDSFKEEMIEKMNEQHSFSFSNNWYKVSFTCICVCLILISFVSVNIWNELKHTRKVLSNIQNELNQMNQYVVRNDKPNLVDSALGKLSIGGMGGGEGIITESIEDLPFDTSTLNVSSLPIYKNPNQRKDSGELINLNPLSERKQLFNQYLKRFGMEGYEIVENYDTLEVYNEKITLKLFGNDEISFWFNEEYENPNPIKIYAETKEEVIQNVKQLLFEHDDWFNEKEYEIDVNQYYYRYYGEETELQKGWSIFIFNDSENITIEMNEEGYLQVIKYTLLTKQTIYVEYPIISVDQAKELLSKGFYYIDGPYGNINDIVGMEIQYRAVDEYILPYYEIYMPAIDQDKRLEFKGFVEYACVYVPAIDVDLLAQDNIYYPNIK